MTKFWFIPPRVARFTRSTLSPSLPENSSDLELAPGRSAFLETGCRGIVGPVPPPLLMECRWKVRGYRLAGQLIFWPAADPRLGFLKWHEHSTRCRSLMPSLGLRTNSLGLTGSAKIRLRMIFSQRAVGHDPWAEAFSFVPRRATGLSPGLSPGFHLHRGTKHPKSPYLPAIRD
jgi:hypothetical protein